MNRGNLGAFLTKNVFTAMQSKVSPGLGQPGGLRRFRTPVNYLRWAGTGYVLQDPRTGEAKYQFAGGLSG